MSLRLPLTQRLGQARRCLFWVKRVGFVTSPECPVYPQTADISGPGRHFAFVLSCKRCFRCSVAERNRASLPALLAPHQAGVADNVGGQNRRQFALLTGQWNFPALLQRIVEGTAWLGNQWEGRDSTIARD